MGEYRSRLNSWRSRTGQEFKRNWWLFAMLFIVHIGQELLKDRLVGGTNRLIDEHAGGVLGFVRPTLLYFAGNPVASLAAICIVIVTLLAIHAYFETRKIPIPVVSKSAQSVQPLSEQKEFLPKGITIPSLTDLCEGKTSIQAAQLVEKYIGKWMRVAGTVANVDQPDERKYGCYVTLDYSHPPSSKRSIWVVARFEESWTDQVELLVSGQRIQIEGKIREIDKGMVTLAKCELIE
jgi:hypothetical protein